MPWSVAAAVGAAVVGGAIASDASHSAADKQSDAANAAQAQNQAQFDKNLELQKPWRDAGMGALSQLSAGVAPGGMFTQPFSYDQYADPGYQFRFQQGQRALDSSAAARGTMLSGGQLKSLVDYGQQAGSQEYGNAYNRWNNDLTNRFNRLASVAGIGQTATRDVSQMGTQLATNNGELMLQGANAQAAGMVGGANAWNNGLTTLGNWWQNRQAANNMNGGGGFTPIYTGTSWGNVGGTSYNSLANGTAGNYVTDLGG
jgi:hypothetical protein